MSQTPFRVIVVDDEPVARRRVVRLLARHSDFEIAAACSGGIAATEQIIEMRPALVFLDIQMPDRDGFGVLAEVGPERMPHVIFTTAFEEHALRAFDLHAIDYLLKPYTEARFDEAVGEARARLTSSQGASAADSLRALLNEMTQQSPAAGTRKYHDRVAVKVHGNTRIVPVADVDWFETDGNYVRIHVAGRKYLIRNTATRLEQMLDPKCFARIHRRFLVNLDRVVEVEPWPGGDAILHLNNGAKLRLSRSYREAFLARMLGDHASSGGAPDSTIALS